MTEEDKNSITYNIHKVLAHSYFMYFVLFLVGVTLDLIFRFEIFPSSVVAPAGFIFLAFATILILWAQKTSRSLKGDVVSKETFCRGPYCYTRTPTHWGLFFLMIGFGIIANAVFVILSTLVSFVLAKFVFINKQEALLEQKYGTPYLEYKKIVKL